MDDDPETRCPIEFGMEGTSTIFSVPLLPPTAPFMVDLPACREKELCISAEALTRLSLTPRSLVRAFPRLRTLKISLEEPSLPALVIITKLLYSFDRHQSLTSLQLFLNGEANDEWGERIFKSRPVHVEFAYLLRTLNQSGGALSRLKHLVLHLGTAYFWDFSKDRLNRLPADPSTFSLRLLKTLESAYLRIPKEAIVANYCRLAKNPNLKRVGFCAEPELFEFFLEKIEAEAGGAAGAGDTLVTRLAGKIALLSGVAPVDFSSTTEFAAPFLLLTQIVTHFTSLTHLTYKLKMADYYPILRTLQRLDSLREVDLLVNYPKEDRNTEELRTLLGAQCRQYELTLEMSKVISLCIQFDGSNALFSHLNLTEQLALGRIFSSLQFLRFSLRHKEKKQTKISSIKTGQPETEAIVRAMFKPFEEQLKKSLKLVSFNVCYKTVRKQFSYEGKPEINWVSPFVWDHEAMHAREEKLKSLGFFDENSPNYQNIDLL